VIRPIVIYADNQDQHKVKLRDVFGRLRQRNLKLLQPDKCEFQRKEVSYLGHLVTDKGIRPDPAKVKSVYEFPTPKNPKQVKMFLGLAGYYRRFIPKFSLIAKPLNRLLRKDVPFTWTLTEQLAFEKLRSVLTNDIILEYPDFSKTFRLTTDASGDAIGSILSQNKLGKNE
jgi:hypothetical protein